MSDVRIPARWFNANAALPELYEPYIDPSTGTSIDPQALEELFAPELVEQELNRSDMYLPIPEEVLRRLGSWRPTPLLRAKGLEEVLGTRCRILYKYEGSSPIGSHKANSGMAQAYYTVRGGRSRVYAETGAGQWGSAISLGSAFTGLQCDVFMVGNSFDAKPSRRILMETFGSTVHRSPTELTDTGRAERRRDPDSPGSLGLAIAEAVETVRADPKASYALGSAFGFVCLHQTVIGQELRDQLATEHLKADLLISCIGGGSSFAGMVFPFLTDRAADRPDLLAVESNAIPKVTRGEFAYDHGDSSGLTPLIKMYTLGHEFHPPGIHSGGLRYHGLAPQVSKLVQLGLARAEAYSQLEIFDSAVLFARTEGLIPAPEAAHSIAAACHYAREHRNEEKTIVFCLTGHGFFDLSAYQTYLSGAMEDSDTPEAEIAESLVGLKALQPSGPAAGRPARSASTTRTASSPAGYDGWQRRHRSASQRPTGPFRGGQRPAGPAEPDRSEVDLSSAKVITESTLRSCHTGTRSVVLAARTIVTPAAAGELQRRGITVRRTASGR